LKDAEKSNAPRVANANMMLTKVSNLVSVSVEKGRSRELRYPSVELVAHLRVIATSMIEMTENCIITAAEAMVTGETPPPVEAICSSFVLLFWQSYITPGRAPPAKRVLWCARPGVSTDSGGSHLRSKPLLVRWPYHRSNEIREGGSGREEREEIQNRCAARPKEA
jgi:hypothetical protein